MNVWILRINVAVWQLNSRNQMKNVTNNYFQMNFLAQKGSVIVIKNWDRDEFKSIVNFVRWLKLLFKFPFTNREKVRRQQELMRFLAHFRIKNPIVTKRMGSFFCLIVVCCAPFASDAREHVRRSFSQLLFSSWDHPFITSVKAWWMWSEKWQFFQMFSTIY